MEAFIQFIVQSVRYGTPLLFGTTGEIITQKSGSLNLGVEGVMAVGAIGGFLFATWTNSLILGILAAFVCGALCGLLFAFLTVTLQANQNVTGLAMTIFGVGLFQFIGQNLTSGSGFPAMSAELAAKVGENGIPLLRDIPVVGDLLFSYNPFVYLGVVIAVLCWIYLFRTRTGLKVRAVGENPAAADGVGVNITRIKYLNIMLGCGICGIGGLYLGMVLRSGRYDGYGDWIAGYGWIAIALVIFAAWSPAKAIGGSFLFGLLLSLQAYRGAVVSIWPAGLSWMNAIPGEFYQMLPFLLTAVILVITSIRKKKDGGSPTALGLNYYREDR